LLAAELHALDDPGQATFYTSGRASNEAAFTYQLFVRAFGTNNLPDCSNMCHESTSVALAESIGIGKASVTMQDVYDAKLIVIAGQNPGTNHPRMLSALEIAKQNGAKILTINPLREAGLVRFKNPQAPRGVVGNGTELTDLHLPIRVNGDLALFQALGSLLVEWDALDHDFINRHTVGFEAWRAHVAAVDWDVVTTTTGLCRPQITEAAGLLRDSRSVRASSSLTRHRSSRR
jgi:anaerobic selenocysteine-containing dehydrogenase